MIPLSVPVISGNEWKYIKECLDTGWVSSVGSYVTRFEEMIADYVGVRYAVATINGTSALHVSLICCGVKAGDEVIVPTLTFIAPVNSVRYCGAEPVFMDCNLETLCIDTTKLAEFIENNTLQKNDGYTYNKDTGRRIKAIIPVHIFGHPVNMDHLARICIPNNIDIIEDAAESLGSDYKGNKTGSFGKVNCFSFNGNKIVTTGGGGMAVTNSTDLAYKIRHLSAQAKKDSIEYEHDEIGYNYRLTNLQAAMGAAQMERLDEFIALKRKNADLYIELLSKLDEVQFICEKSWAKSNCWFYTIKTTKEDTKPLIEHLLSRNIQVRPVWRLIHTLPMYNKCQSYHIDKAVDAYESCINIPCSVSLKEEEIEYVAYNITSYFKK